MAPTIGATQNIQSCCIAQPSAKSAVAVERAGFTEVLETGIDIKCINVKPRPIGMGAKPAGTAPLVAPRMIIRKNAVSTASVINTETSE